jgi:hypothetical protein
VRLVCQHQGFVRLLWMVVGCWQAWISEGIAAGQQLDGERATGLEAQPGTVEA